MILAGKYQVNNLVSHKSFFVGQGGGFFGSRLAGCLFRTGDNARRRRGFAPSEVWVRCPAWPWRGCNARTSPH